MTLVQSPRNNLKQHEVSSELFSPLYYNRMTISPSKYEEYQRSKSFYEKSLENDPTTSDLQRIYDVTMLKKSDVRLNDELLPKCPSSEMNRLLIDKPFPAEHPYASHVSRFALFPDYSSPDDPYTGDSFRSEPPMDISKAASSYDVKIESKAKGFSRRHETQVSPSDKNRKPLQWLGEFGFPNLRKSADSGRQAYYPTPTKLVHPNLLIREKDQRIELRTANALRNVERDQHKTTYDYNFTEQGPSNAMQLDDYHEKLKEEISDGANKRNRSLKPTSSATPTMTRPLEGRYARLLQNRRLLASNIRYKEDNPVPDSADVMDLKTYSSFPRDLSSSSDQMWMKMQSEKHPEKGLEDLKVKKEFVERTKNSEMFEKVDGTSDDLSYLERYKKERDKTFQKIEDNRRKDDLLKKYDSKRNLISLRSKIDQFATREAPRAMIQHDQEMYRDKKDLISLKFREDESEKFSSDLKYSTEKITNTSKVDSLYNRLVESCKTQPQDIQDHMIIHPPTQNHSSLSSRDYVPKTNPYSFSSRSDHPEITRDLGSGKRSILRPPGSPPRFSGSRNISFNEVVKVKSTSEFGDEFSYPLNTSRPSNVRPSTPTTSKRSSIYGEISRGPALRSSYASDHASVTPSYQKHWKWNYDCRDSTKFDSLFESKRPRSTSGLSDLQNAWNRTSVHREFHQKFPENAPDMRKNSRRAEFAESSNDLRYNYSTKHREKRHSFQGFNSYYLYNRNHVL